MTRSEDRSERSLRRSIEHKRKRMITWTVFAVSLFLYYGIPFLWYGAIDLGWIHPSLSAEFKASAYNLRQVLFLILLFSLIEILNYTLKGREKKAKSGPQSAPSAQPAR